MVSKVLAFSIVRVLVGQAFNESNLCITEDQLSKEIRNCPICNVAGKKADTLPRSPSMTRGLASGASMVWNETDGTEASETSEMYTNDVVSSADDSSESSEFKDDASANTGADVTETVMTPKDAKDIISNKYCKTTCCERMIHFKCFLNWMFISETSKCPFCNHIYLKNSVMCLLADFLANMVNEKCFMEPAAYTKIIGAHSIEVNWNFVCFVLARRFLAVQYIDLVFIDNFKKVLPFMVKAENQFNITNLLNVICSEKNKPVDNPKDKNSYKLLKKLDVKSSDYDYLVLMSSIGGYFNESLTEKEIIKFLKLSIEKIKTKNQYLLNLYFCKIAELIFVNVERAAFLDKIVAILEDLPAKNISFLINEPIMTIALNISKLKILKQRETASKYIKHYIEKSKNFKLLGVLLQCANKPRITDEETARSIIKAIYKRVYGTKEFKGKNTKATPESVFGTALKVLSDVSLDHIQIIGLFTEIYFKEGFGEDITRVFLHYRPRIAEDFADIFVQLVKDKKKESVEFLMQYAEEASFSVPNMSLIINKAIISIENTTKVIKTLKKARKIHKRNVWAVVRGSLLAQAPATIQKYINPIFELSFKEKIVYYAKRILQIKNNFNNSCA
ncbi:hypothetical protein ENBRE01_2089 [Enteropsectra breve]|nr:hypothetical protein ENBRE01_2089 [Enteropsectra breve]